MFPGGEFVFLKDVCVRDGGWFVGDVLVFAWRAEPDSLWPQNQFCAHGTFPEHRTASEANGKDSGLVVW